MIRTPVAPSEGRGALAQPCPKESPKSSGLCTTSRDGANRPPVGASRCPRPVDRDRTSRRARRGRNDRSRDSKDPASTLRRALRPDDPDGRLLAECTARGRTFAPAWSQRPHPRLNDEGWNVGTTALASSSLSPAWQFAVRARCPGDDGLPVAIGQTHARVHTYVRLFVRAGGGIRLRDTNAPTVGGERVSEPPYHLAPCHV